MPILKRNERLYGVLLTDTQEVHIVEIKPGEEIFDCGRRAIGCEWIELAEPPSLEKNHLVMMIDEEAKIRGGTQYVNCIASRLYESEKHGDMIVGNAVLVKAGEEELQMLTGEEAAKLAKQMILKREKSIEIMSEAIDRRKGKTEPQKLEKVPQDKTASKRRQPCRKSILER